MNIKEQKYNITDNQGKTIQIFPSISIFEIPDEALTNNYVGYIYEFYLLEDVEVFGKVVLKKALGTEELVKVHLVITKKWSLLAL